MKKNIEQFFSCLFYSNNVIKNFLLANKVNNKKWLKNSKEELFHVDCTLILRHENLEYTGTPADYTALRTNFRHILGYGLSFSISLAKVGHLGAEYNCGKQKYKQIDRHCVNLYTEVCLSSNDSVINVNLPLGQRVERAYLEVKHIACYRNLRRKAIYEDYRLGYAAHSARINQNIQHIVLVSAVQFC